MCVQRGCGVNRRFTHSASSIAAALGAGIIALSARPSTHLSANNAQPGHGAVLVELFTCEGCSSCPPADALLQKVNGKYSDADQLIVGVSEHVTYWNGLGWSDPFSSSAYTERQNAYGQRFHLDSVYTPQIVVNGQEQIVGSDSAVSFEQFDRRIKCLKLAFISSLPALIATG